MTQDRIKSVIVGGGLAGLSAGIKLLEERPAATVTL
jgi:protoporphyrinogen oxidase